MQPTHVKTGSTFFDSRHKVLRIRAFGDRALKGALLSFVVAFALIVNHVPVQAVTPDSFADLAEQLSPAVVNISTSQTVGTEAAPEMEIPEFPPGSPFEEFFRDFFENRMNKGPQKVRSLGSGFVIDSKGIIVTNNHVIDGADEITVKMVDGKEYEAELLGTDDKTDVAVLKIKEKNLNLPAVNFGNSDALRVGDWVVAIGNPFGLGGTVTAGIVSARNRDINAGPYDDFIQTDASINRGNSGGPLFNLAGEVVGVNTAIFSPTGGSVGIGFAIPSDIVSAVVDQLVEFGETRRGWLGVHIQTVTPDIAESMGMSEAKGALVASADETGPAFAAGIKHGDVIIKFDGKDVPRMRDLPRIVADTEIGKTVPVVIFRDGKEKTVKVKIQQLNEKEPEVAAVEESEDGAQTKLGLTFSAITPVLREQYQIPEDVVGVVITNVAFDSDAAEKLIPGDVIVEVAQEPVTTPEEAIARINKLSADNNKPILFLVSRRGQLNFRSIRPKAE